MLELRPICEHCAVALPPDATKARICSFECTFCAECAEGVLANVCPNCGGGFAPRPIRPKTNWMGGNYLGKHPAGAIRKHRPANLLEHAVLVQQLAAIEPEQR
jgi:uncharacterized protein